LGEIKTLYNKLSHRKVSMLGNQQARENLESEKKQLMKSIKECQQDYFEKKIMNKKEFDRRYSSFRERLIEINEEIELINEKIISEGETGKKKFLIFANKIYFKIKGFFIR
jgi:ABC-type phosphate transport system auxiliary subunit